VNWLTLRWQVEASTFINTGFTDYLLILVFKAFNCKTNFPFLVGNTVRSKWKYKVIIHVLNTVIIGRMLADGR
jgi:hypothetical protein